MDAEQGWMLLLFVMANFVLAGIGARLGERGDGSELWYNRLSKPGGYPPEVLFAPIWSLVAIATGVAGWWIWRDAQLSYSSGALMLYGFALVFNAVWQGVSIGLRRLGLGIAVGWLLWVTIALTAWADGAQAEPVPWHLLWLFPYWLWVGVCVRWNHRLWQANQPPSASDPGAANDSPLPGEQVS
ncbi:MAG TPA: TspO/MBR family protein [Terriglobales bacterium]|nr:TspO/MBR family protein [Terriglobales bacterium]